MLMLYLRLPPGIPDGVQQLPSQGALAELPEPTEQGEEEGQQQVVVMRLDSNTWNWT